MIHRTSDLLMAPLQILMSQHLYTQEDKRQIAEAALTDGMAGQQQRLSFNELRRLFGLAR